MKYSTIQNHSIPLGFIAALGRAILRFIALALASVQSKASNTSDLHNQSPIDLRSQNTFYSRVLPVLSFGYKTCSGCCATTSVTKRNDPNFEDNLTIKVANSSSTGTSKLTYNNQKRFYRFVLP